MFISEMEFEDWKKGAEHSGKAAAVYDKQLTCVGDFWIKENKKFFAHKVCAMLEDATDSGTESCVYYDLREVCA